MTQPKSGNRQSGFTIIETMIAIAIMSIGIVTLIAAFATAVSATNNAQENLIARQKTLEAMESIYTARNAQQVDFAQIANISSGGIFTTGSTQLLAPGPDGLVTARDRVTGFKAVPSDPSDLAAFLTRADRDQILCDCNVARIILGPDSQPLDVGREKRTVPRWT